MKSRSRFANGEKLPVVGVCSALVSMKNIYYTVSFSVDSHLIRSAIIGLDALSQQETVPLQFGGKRLNWTFLIWLLLLKVMSLDQ